MYKSLISEVGKKKVDWCKVEKLVKSLGVSINDKEDEESTLSSIFDVVESGAVALKITKIFLDNGYDVTANAGFNGAICLENLCWSGYGDYILPIAELLIAAGADVTLKVKGDESVLDSIDWTMGYWMERRFQEANLFESYQLMADRAIEKRAYRGIRAFGESVGKIVTKVEKVTHENNVNLSEDAFDGAIVFWCGGEPLVVRKYIDFMINPYYKDEAVKIEDVSKDYAEIIGAKIKELDFASQRFAGLDFDNGYRIWFTNSNSGEGEKTGKALLTRKTDKNSLIRGMTIEQIGFSEGFYFSEHCRAYSLDDLFLQSKDKLFHVYGIENGENYSKLCVEELDSKWCECVEVRADMEDLIVEDVHIQNEGEQWIKLKIGDDHLYITGEVYGGIRFFRTNKELERPFGVRPFNDFCKKIEFYQYG